MPPKAEGLVLAIGLVCPGLSWLVLTSAAGTGTRPRALALACLAKGRGAEGDPQGGALGKKFRGAAVGCVGDFPRRKALAPFG